MRRWFGIIFIVVLVIAIILSGILQLAQLILPNDLQKSPLPLLAAIGITGLLGNVVLAVMQWFGISPFDLLPEQTIEEKLRGQDKSRFQLTKNKNPQFLKGQTRSAADNKEWDWVIVFSHAWLRVKPYEKDAYEYLAQALIQTNRLEEGINCAKRLIDLAPLDQHGYSFLGEAYTELA